MTSYAVFSYRYGQQYKLQVEELLYSTKSYTWNDRYNIIMPIPGANIKSFFFNSEFQDNFKVNEYNQFGIFDDGLDLDKKKKALIIGDSFARGVGSVDNLKNGWVEISEKNLQDIDLLNLGLTGSGQLLQMKNYDRIKSHFPHDIVILSFYPNGDFDDNLYDYFDPNDYLKNLPDNYDKSKYLEMIQYGQVWDQLMHTKIHYLIYNSISLYSVWLYKVIKHKFFKKESFNDPYGFLAQYESYKNDINKYNNLFNQQELRQSTTNIKDETFYYTINDNLYKKSNRHLTEKIVKHSSDIVNSFYNQVKEDNKTFILIIHPSKEEIYLDGKFSEYDFNYARNKFKKLINQNIPVLDITSNMREVAILNNLSLYYSKDGHYNINGYKSASRFITNYLGNTILQ